VTNLIRAFLSEPPTLVVNGALLLDNPGLRDIRQHLAYRS
jgi:hypothetical protein